MQAHERLSQDGGTCHALTVAGAEKNDIGEWARPLKEGFPETGHPVATAVYAGPVTLQPVLSVLPTSHLHSPVPSSWAGGLLLIFIPQNLAPNSQLQQTV